MNYALRSLLWIFLRDVLAVAMVAGVFFLMICDARSFGGINDNGYVENAQVVLCTAAAALFLAAARRRTPWRRAMILISLTLFAMAVRELDGLTDRIFHGAWKVFAAPFLALFVWQLCRHWKEACDSLLALLRTPTGRHLEIATVSLLVFSRLVGTKIVWRYFIEDRVVLRATKGVIEEGTELFGYMLLFLSALDALLLAARKERTESGKTA